MGGMTRKRLGRSAQAALAVLGWLVLGAAAPAQARVTRIEITSKESPTFDATSFGAVGSYEKLVGRVFGEVDPADRRNAVITDIELAPRNERGLVEYSTDILILKPVDMSKANRRLFYELTNRGGILGLGAINEARASNDPTNAADAGLGFLMRQGYVLLFSGWDVTAAGPFRTKVPVAVQKDGSPITGPALQEFVFNSNERSVGRLTYPAANLDPKQATLTVRTLFDDPPETIPAGGWEFVDARTVRLLPAGTPFAEGRIFELAYTATQPLVAGLGFAAVRDLAAFLRRETADAQGTANPLAGTLDQVYGFGVSQPARFLRDYLALGFNRDEQDRMVFSGMLDYIAGASGGFFNFRFAQPGNTHRQHIGRLLPERQFPFAGASTFDPVTRRTDGRLASCTKTESCPKIFEVNSANEYWVKGGSLLHTDTRGKDLPDPAGVRFYLLSGLPHAAGRGAGICQQPRNSLRPGPVLRALLVALDDWVSGRAEPPASRVPRRADGTLVPSLPQSGVGFPKIPGVTYNGRMTTGDRLDFGRSFADGILTKLPPASRGAPYPVFVPKTDADGNELAGIRLPEVAVPLATFTGWNLRRTDVGGDDLCDASGQEIPFARTKEERTASGDPRLSIDERYETAAAFVAQRKQAAERLRADRLLLDEDIDRAVATAEATGLRPPPPPVGAGDP